MKLTPDWSMKHTRRVFESPESFHSKLLAGSLIALAILLLPLPARAGSPQKCAAGQVNCGSACADVSTDPHNCGSCGVVCQPGQECVSGACTAAASCAAGMTKCGARCVNTAIAPKNCGSCGVVCQPSQECVNGTCQR